MECFYDGTMNPTRVPTAKPVTDNPSYAPTGDGMSSLSTTIIQCITAPCGDGPTQGNTNTGGGGDVSIANIKYYSVYSAIIAVINLFVQFLCVKC